tara:strand:+ start:712 stop:1563 length:852 start_codon:yes stop_codon:yes gene_type:complete
MPFDYNKLDTWLKNSKKNILIMGVLNVTPDSFSDGGLYFKKEDALDHAKRLIYEGVDIIDIGGESTRPGSNPVSIQEEIDRTIPVIESLKNFDPNCVISIDTYKFEVAEKAVLAGAKIINDISGLSFDSNMVSLVVNHKLPVIIMHMKGTPKNMQNETYYNNLIYDINDFFKKQIQYAKSKGVKDEQIILDPGIGFGKSFDDNFKIIKNLNLIKSLGYPLLIGTSRKAFIGNILKNAPVEDRLFGTAATISIGINNGARIIRVHDVYQMKQVAIVTEKLIGLK